MSQTDFIKKITFTENILKKEIRNLTYKMVEDTPSYRLDFCLCGVDDSFN